MVASGKSLRGKGGSGYKAGQGVAMGAREEGQELKTAQAALAAYSRQPIPKAPQAQAQYRKVLADLVSDVVLAKARGALNAARTGTVANIDALRRQKQRAVNTLSRTDLYAPNDLYRPASADAYRMLAQTERRIRSLEQARAGQRSLF